MTETFAIEEDLSSKIEQIDWEKVSAPRRETEEDEGIDDYGDYAVVDNFLINPDDFLEALLKVPADYLNQVINISHSETGEYPFGIKQPGIEQSIPTGYIMPTLFGVYKSLIDTEFVPGDCEENLRGEGLQKWIQKIPYYSETKGVTYYNGVLCSKRADLPEFSKWEFNALLFLQDDPNSSFDLYDLNWKDKYYSCAEDVMSEDPTVVQDIADWLDKNALPLKESMVYEKFNGDDHFVKTRSVEVKKNRLVLFKGHTFRTMNYGGGKDLYTLNIGMNQVPKEENQQQNEFTNDDTYS